MSDEDHCTFISGDEMAAMGYFFYRHPDFLPYSKGCSLRG
jgi:hypothetical protein